jgi:hypothetical protein
MQHISMTVMEQDHESKVMHFCKFPKKILVFFFPWNKSIPAKEILIHSMLISEMSNMRSFFWKQAQGIHFVYP